MKDKEDLHNALAELHIKYEEDIISLVKDLSDDDLKEFVIYLQDNKTGEYIDPIIKILKNDFAFRWHLRRAQQSYENGGSGFYCVYHACDIEKCSEKHLD